MTTGSSSAVYIGELFSEYFRTVKDRVRWRNTIHQWRKITILGIGETTEESYIYLKLSAPKNNETISSECNAVIDEYNIVDQFPRAGLFFACTQNDRATGYTPDGVFLNNLFALSTIIL